MPENKTFCELMKEQLIDEDKAGELYETARKLLAEDHEAFKKLIVTKPESMSSEELHKAYSMKMSPTTTDDAVLEKIAIDERSHKVLLQVLYGRLCP